MPELNELVVNFPHNFFAIEEEYSTLDKSRFVVMQAPFEGTVSYGQGTAAGPAAILKASQQVELFDEITGKEHIPERGCLYAETNRCHRRRLKLFSNVYTA